MHFNWFLGVDGYKVGHPPLGNKTYTQDEYLTIAEAQMREIFGKYTASGELGEIWFDGGTGPSNATAARVVKDIAPTAMCHSCSPFTQDPNDPSKGYGVRWMGNEEAMMPLPSWAASTGGQHGGGVGGGDPYGDTFQPPSCDAVLRSHYWFWEPNTEHAIKSTKRLVDNYLTSVGRAANLILNIAPDGTGGIPAEDVSRYAQMGAAIECLFSTKVGTGVAQASNTSMEWQFDTPIPSHNLSVWLLEDQSDGQLINAWSLDCQLNNAASWTPCHADVGVGHKRIVNIVLPATPAASVTAIRLNVHTHFAMPIA